MKLTTREKTMIGILLLVLLAAVFVLALRSYSKKIDDKQAELDGLRAQSESLRSTAESVERMEAAIPILRDNAKAFKSKLYSIQKNREFDRMVTSLAHRCGLTPISLIINDKENGQIPPYMTETNESGSSGQQRSYIWTNSAVFTVEGAEAQMYSFIDAIAADPAMRVAGISYLTPEKKDGKTEFEITLEIYMYDKDGTAQEQVNDQAS